MIPKYSLGPFTPHQRHMIQTYRVPGFLATSFQKDKANVFVLRAVMHQHLPGVMWVVHLDPKGATDYKYRCLHVNYVDNSNVKGEEEFLFAPYSAFKVISVSWSPEPENPWKPHVIHVEAILDNWKISEEVETAPWS